MSPTLPLLLPAPRQLSFTTGEFSLPSQALIVIESPALLFEAQTAQTALLQHTKPLWEIVAGRGYPDTGLTLSLDPTLTHAQGYTLTISASGIVVRGADSAGVYYGVCTLRQLLQAYGKTLPALIIEDWPDFPARGVMLDISRDKVPTLQTVLDLVDRLAGWKVNQLQLYTEHTFAYRHHPEVWADASPFTGQEILELDAFCRQRHVELVPNQNSLGHMERWLKFPRYHPLAESPDGFTLPWGVFSPPTTLNPIDPGSLALIAGLYDELLPHFTSSRFNVGGDEPWELGKGKSKPEVDARGGRVYLDYILGLHREVTKHGRQMQFWADIIVKHPELVPELPKDVTAMLWGYEGGESADRIWQEQCELVAGAGVPFYVCPGTSSWNTLAGRTDNTIDNCRITAVNGLKHGAVGYLVTDWGDNGHWQPLPVSYPGFAYAAAISWAYDANEAIDLPAALDRFVFEDRAGVMGKLACDLGNVYQIVGPHHINGQVLAYVLQTPREVIDPYLAGVTAWGGAAPDIRPETLRRAIARIDEIAAGLDRAEMAGSDQSLIGDELWQAASLLKQGANRLLLVQGETDVDPRELLRELEGLVEQQRVNWLARNRPGGLSDSLRRFDPLLNEYRSVAGI